MSDSLTADLAHALNLPPAAADEALHHLVGHLQEQLDERGRAHVAGLGTFRRADGGLTFEPDPTLARAVNHRYVGLPTIEATPPSAHAAAAAGSAPPDALAAGPADEPPPPPLPPNAEPVADDPAGVSADAEGSAGEAPFDEAPQWVPLDQAGGAPPPPTADVEEAPSEDEPQVKEPASETPAAAPFDEPEPVEEEFVEEDVPTEKEEGVSAEEEPTDGGARAVEGEPLATGEEPGFEGGSAAEGEPALEEDEPALEEDDDELLEEVWTAHAGPRDGDHPLGPMPPGLIEDAEFEVEEPDASGESDALDEPHDEEPAAPAAPLEEPPEPVAEPVEDATEESVDAEPAPTAAATPDPLPAPTPPPVTVTAKQPPPPAPPPKERSRLPLALAAGAVLVVALIGIVWLLNRGEVAPPDVAAIPPAPATADTAAADRPEPAAGALPPAESDTAATDVPAPPSEPADPLRAAVAIAPADGGYTWVIASEASQAVAERRAEEFRARGFRTGVISAPLNGRTAHRVGIGQFETSDEALRYRDELPADVPEGTWLLRL